MKSTIIVRLAMASPAINGPQNLIYSPDIRNNCTIHTQNRHTLPNSEICRRETFGQTKWHGRETGHSKQRPRRFPTGA